MASAALVILTAHSWTTLSADLIYFGSYMCGETGLK
jgi:hypothetical protein